MNSRCNSLNLNLYYQNTRGLRTKTHDFYCNLSCCNYDVIILTETWLNNKIFNNEIFDDRYVIYRRDRESLVNNKKKDGGGVLIAVRRWIHSKRLSHLETYNEDLWVELAIPLGKSIININICAVYFPPPVHKNILELFVDNYDANRAKLNTSYTLIAGDFNVSSYDWNPSDNEERSSNFSQIQQILVDFASINNFHQCNDIKNINNRILDFIFTDIVKTIVTRSDDILSKVDCFHPPLQINIPLDISNTSNFNSSVIKYNFFRADYDLINEYLKSMDWENIFSSCMDINEMVDIFESLLKDTIHKHVPKYKAKSNKYPYWYSRTLIKMLNEKNKTRLKFKKFANPRDGIEFELLKKRCDDQIKHCYKIYHDRIENNLGTNPKLFWSFLKKKRLFEFLPGYYE